MLRPYLAIIKDSFRAAIASRVLIMMLVLITLFLLALAPFRLTEEMSWEVNRDVHLGDRPDASYSLLVENRENSRREDLVYIWNQLPDDLRTRMLEMYEYDQKKLNDELEEPDMEHEGFGRLGFYSEFVEALNELIKDPDFYNEEIWSADSLLSAEANELASYGTDKLDTLQRRRLNRLIITQAFNGTILPPSDSSAKIYYFREKWQLSKLPTGKVGFHQGLAGALPWILDKFVLSAGMLISILVTASIMPSMFEHGSLSLLLSKPIYRWALFVAKFVGACAFALLLSAYLFIGLWVILGIRISYWDSSLLYSIPIYVVVFAIYYSVSSFLGMFFKNTIIAVVGTILFWIACFFVGETNKSFEKYTFLSDGIAVAHHKGAVVQTDRFGLTRFWSEGDEDWIPVMTDRSEYEQQTGLKIAMMLPFFPRSIQFPPPVEPVYAEKYDVWVGVMRSFEDFQNLQPSLVYTTFEDAFESKEAGRLPSNALGFLVHPNGDVITVTGRGDFYVMDKDPKKVHQQVLDSQTGSSQQNSKDKSDGGKNKQGDAVTRPNNSKLSAFSPIGPDRPVDIRDLRAIDLNQKNGKIAVYRSGSVFVFEQKDDGEYQLEQKADLELGVDSAMTAWIAYQGDTIFVCLGNGEIFSIDGQTLQKKKSYQPESRTAIFDVSASPNGVFLAVTYRNGNLWLLDTENPERMKKLRFQGQGDVKSASFDRENNLCFVSKTDRVTILDPRAKKKLEVKQNGEWYFIKDTYHNVIRWVYVVFPKPGEFYKLVSHLASSRQSKTNRDLDLTTATEPEKPWEPFISGLCFMFGMVLLSCIIFMRADY